MNLMGLLFGYIASVLGLGAYHSMDDNRFDDFGGNATDREYIQYLHDMVNRGEMTEEEALSKLKSNWKGEGDPTEYYNSYTKNANGTYSVGGYGFGMPDLNGLINSLTAYYTRNTLTGAEQEQNAFNAEQAQMSRDFTEYMARNKYSMETQSMQDAGVNPAMVYGGGSLVPTAANGAVASGSPLSGGNIADLLSTMVRMPLEMKKLDAEIRSIDAGTDKTKTETNVLNAKLPFEVDALKAQVRESNLSSDAQEIINSYLDKQQEAEIRMKNATAAQEEEAVQKMVKEIEKMDYEELTMVISWMETNERILNLQKQRDLTDTQMKELESLIRVNNATASKLNLDVSNYDDITVLGTASTNMKFGPFSVGQGEPISLAMIKAAREAREKEKEKEKKPKTMKEIKDEYPE